MLRRLSLLPSRTVGAAATCSFGGRRGYVTEAPEPEVVQAHSVEKMWGLWNEGNLFSLSVNELGAFLEAQKVKRDPKWKKAALVRQVEELLQANEQREKAKTRSGGGAAPPPTQWDQPGGGSGGGSAPGQSEMLLDLTQSGFYAAETQAAPKAFQLLVDQASTDLVVCRLDTTGFPGYPSSSEQYTLASADAAQASRSRFIKTLKWGGINLRTLQLDGQLHVDFGKLVLLPEVQKRKQRVVSAWTLQQRLQASAPYHWVSAMPPSATNLVETFCTEKGFELAGKTKIEFDVVVHREKDTISVTLDSAGKVVTVARQWEKLQTSLFTRADGADRRVLFRARKPIAPDDDKAFRSTPIVDVVSDEIKVLLPPEKGNVLYCSENEIRTWTRPLAGGGKVTLTENKRQPLIISRDVEEGERVEYTLDAQVPRDATDIADMALELESLSKAIADSTAESFIDTFGTTPKPVELELE